MKKEKQKKREGRKDIKRVGLKEGRKVEIRECMIKREAGKDRRMGVGSMNTQEHRTGG